MMLGRLFSLRNRSHNSFGRVEIVEESISRKSRDSHPREAVASSREVGGGSSVAIDNARDVSKKGQSVTPR